MARGGDIEDIEFLAGCGVVRVVGDRPKYFLMYKSHPQPLTGTMYEETYV